jgi:hypothetical protein
MLKNVKTLETYFVFKVSGVVLPPEINAHERKNHQKSNRDVLETGFQKRHDG